MRSTVLTRRVRAPVLLASSSVFHYLGPAFAVLVFVRLDPLGVAWLRIATAAAVFAAWRRPWRLLRRLTAAQRRDLVALGAVLAAMNSVFYLAIARLPLSTVGAIEFLGVVMLAASGVRTVQNAIAVVLAVGGVATLADVRLAGEPLGFVLAFANCALFMLYVVVGHRVASGATQRGGRWGGVDQLGASMLVATIVAAPWGLVHAAPALTHPGWLAAGVAVGICSSVIPYVTDQLAMALLPRSAFALALSVLPACATVVGLVVLAQRPTAADLFGVALVIAGLAVHQDIRRDTRQDFNQRKLQEGIPCSTSDSARPG
ncbi:EamA family transporter [Actinopolymorpha rutila]|uniref:Inner membrane transporter RhtA n=1 Tax=Actinopolymorpha rutila TaxID=446787 RepID=A0A852ZNQ4_9ACTN|nr:EamA family transporter [Actinopolymorpha rutila]NYH90720.1 inner membrane transporter RhtA [Actinopolymorpha rutila]